MSPENIVTALVCWAVIEGTRRLGMWVLRRLYRAAFPSAEAQRLVRERQRAAREDKAVEQSFFRWERERQRGSVTSPVKGGKR